MNPEQVIGITLWWEEQTFPGKELFSLDDNGTLTLVQTGDLKERVIATIPADGADQALKHLTDKFEQVQTRIRDTEGEWLAAEDKIKMADKVSHLRDYLQTVNAVGDLRKAMEDVSAWQQVLNSLFEENLKVKTKIAETAESLVEHTEWKETTQAYRDLTEQWKQAGPVERVINDQLWSRIEAAKNKFLDRKKENQDSNEKDLLLTLDLKIELAEEAEALANSEEWKATTEAYQKIIEKWKAIGRTLPKKNEELWQRIMTARSTFFDRKKDHYNMIQKEQEVNYEKKISIAERAEALKDSQDWNATTLAFAALMDEWKKTGRVAAERGDEIWKRYNDAQEQFFEAKKAHTDTLRVTFEQNYQKKSALLKRAEEIKNSSRWNDTTIEMNHLFDEWKKIGPVAKEHNNTIWNAFLAARKHFFGRKDAHRDQRKQFLEAQKSARMEQAYTIVMKMRQEIAAEEEKLADFQNALDNVTPGKKAEELKTHLEVLISDSNAKMKRLKEKLAAGEDELRHIEEEEKERAARQAEKETKPEAEA